MQVSFKNFMQRALQNTTAVAKSKFT